MKNLYLRSIAALLCAASLSACGGSGNGSLILSGSITGLTKSNLVLLNGANNSTVSIVSGATAFAFPTLIGSDSAYNVTIQTQPDKAVCTVASGSGKSSSINVTTVVLTCLTNQYHIGGIVKGLVAGETLTLVNGKDNVAVPNASASAGAAAKANTSAGELPFTFGATVGDGAPYTITVLPSSVPSGKQCTVTNGSGYLGSADYYDAVVTCN